MKRLLVAIALFAALLTFCGCSLTPEQRAALDRYEASVKEIEDRAPVYIERINEVVKAVEEKRIPLAEGKRLVMEIAANYQADKDRVSELKDAIAEMRAKEVPWWHYIGPVALGILGLASGFLDNKKARLATNIRDALIIGIEAGDNKATKDAIKGIARGNPEMNAVLHAAVKRLTADSG